MSDSILKIKSVPFYNSEIVLYNPIIDSCKHSKTVEIRVNINNISISDKLAIDRWHTNIFSPTCKLNIEWADAEIYDNSKDIKLIISASVFPICINYNEIIFNARLFNIKKLESISKPDNISWDEYFSNLAVLTSLRSKDTTKVSAVLVSPEKKVLSLGYNGYVKGVDESIFPKNREAENLSDTKYPILSDEIISSDPISWDEYFMSVAQLTSMRSKDMNTKVGAVLVDSKNRIIGAGYNGLPSHIDESKFPTSNNKSLPYNETKYAYVAHAELNSILNTTVYDLADSKIYCTLFPCNECAKVIIQKEISEIIYLSDKYHNDPIYIASRKLLDSAGIPYRHYANSIKI